MSAVSGRGSRHEKWRRIGRGVGLGLAVFTALSTAVTVGAWRYAGSGAGRARLAGIAQRQLVVAIPGLRVREVGRDSGGTLVAVGVDIWDGDGRRAVHVDRVRVRPHWTSLLRRRVAIEELRIEGVHILGRPVGDVAGAEMNLATLLAPRPKASTNESTPVRNDGADHLSLPVRIDRLVVVGAAADLWAGGDSPRVTAHGLTFEARLDSAGRRTTATIEHLSVAGAVGERAFTASASARGRLEQGAVEAVLESLRVTGATPAGEVALRAGVGGEGGALKLWLVATGPQEAAANLSGSVTLGPAGALGHYDVRFSTDVPVLAALLPDAPAGTLSLRGRARGVGTPLAPGSRADVTMFVPPGSIAGHPIDRAYVDASTRGTAWSVARADASAPGISVHVQGDGDGPRVRARLTVDVDDVGAARRTAGLRKAAAPAVPGRGHGHLEASIDGRVDRQVSFQLGGRARTLTAATWGRLAALDLSVRGTATHDESWTVTARGQGRVAGLDGPAAALGGARFQAEASVQNRGAQPLQLASLIFSGSRLRVGKATFDRVDVRARGDRSALSLSANAAGRAGSATVAAHGRRRSDRLDLTIDRLDLALAAPGPRQRLALGRPASLVIRPGQELELANLDLRASGEVLTGNATISATVRLSRPPAGIPWARADVTVDQLTTAEIPPVTGTIHALADGRRARADVALRMGASTLTAKLDAPAPIRASLGELRLSREGRLDLSLDTRNLDLASLPPLQQALSRYGLVGGRITAHASVSGDVAHPDAKLALDVRALELRDVTGDGRDAVVHTIPGIGVSVQVATLPEKIETSGKVFMYGAGVASFSATLNAALGALLAGADPRQIPIAARIDVPRFQINALKSLSDELRDTRGWLAGGATIAGPLAHPRGQAEFSVSGVQVDRLSVGRVVVGANTDGRTLQVNARIDDGGATGSLTATAQMSLGAVPTLDARVRARGLNPGLARPFIAGLRELDGVVDADVRAGGTWPGVRLDGRLFLYRGRVGIVGQPTFRDVGLAVAMRPGRIDLEKLQMYSGDGSLQASGWVTLDGLSPRGGVMKGDAHRFTIAAAGVSGARLDGAWAVEVAQRDSVLAGKIDVPHAAVWLPKLALGGRRPQRITPHDDVRFVDGASRAAEARQQNEAQGGGKSPLQVNVQGKARTIYVRGKDMDLELESTATLKTPPAGGPLQLLGSVRIRRGRINIQGQRFEVGTGAITFDGPLSTPRIDINLSRDYPDARVLVEIHGRPSKPELRLSSEPPIYDQGQIVSLILTGQVQGRPGAGGGSFDPTATIATAVLRKLADKVAPEIGLDVIRIERAKPAADATTGGGDFAGRVEVGKYVNDRVYVSYAHRFGATERQNSNEAHAEYRLSAHWLAETVFGDAGVGGVDAFWIHRY